MTTRSSGGRPRPGRAPALRLASYDPAGVRADALIVGVTCEPGDEPRLAGRAAELDGAFPGGLSAALRAAGATGVTDQVVRIPTFGAITAPLLVAVGLGRPGVDGTLGAPDVLRRAAGAAARRLAGVRSAATTLAADFDGTPDADGTAGERLRAVAEGLALGGYTFQRYRTDRAEHPLKPPLDTATVLCEAPRDRAARAAVERAGVLAEAVALARDLVNMPAGELHPADLATAARDAGTAVGLSVDVLDEKALAKGRFGGILGVGQGASHPPRLVRMGYRAPGARRSVAVVGKGITFDSGGLSLKPATAMEWMKADMAGAAAVVGALVGAARLKLPVNVTGWLPTAENMPGGAAIRPGDVLRIYGGRTVEVLNTDAEGRLVLADAITRAGEEQPDVIIDLATLTGAQVVALGGRTSGVMANDDALRGALIDAAERAGEPAWPMPLPRYLRDGLDSPVADLRNVAGDRSGGMLVAGLFLADFVPDGVSWAHLDIAGPAYNESDAWGYTPRGGTGAGVRTVIEYLSGLR